MTFRRAAIALCLAFVWSHAHAQVPHDQADARVFGRGPINMQISNHVDDAGNLFILINANDTRSVITSVALRSGAKNLKFCYPIGAATNSLACQYTWLRSSMPATSGDPKIYISRIDYTVRVTLRNSIWYEVDGKWARPDITAVPPATSYCTDGVNRLTTDAGEPLTCSNTGT